MNLNDFLAHVSSGKKVLSGSEEHRYMTKLAFEAMKITSVINQGFHEPNEIRRLMEKLTGKQLDESFTIVGGVPAKIIKMIPNIKEVIE